MDIRKEYLRLYDEADALLQKYKSLCNHNKNGRCQDYRLHPIRKNCCNGCQHLGKNGCKVKSLQCKVWLCWSLAKKYPELQEGLQAIAQEAWDLGLPFDIRNSMSYTIGVWRKWREKNPSKFARVQAKRGKCRLQVW